MLDEIDQAVSQARDSENGNIEVIKIGSSHLATKLNFSQSTICRNGYPEFFTTYYDSVAYRENNGLIIDVEKWVEERKKQREKLAEKNKEDDN